MIIVKEIQDTHNTPGVIASDEYYTPLEFVKSLGEFDTDPCTPVGFRWRTANIMYNKEDDGLAQQWYGRVWLNPPYSSPLVTKFMKKMSEHRNGIALLLPKFGTKMFRDYVYPYADGIYVLAKRIKFFGQDYVQMKSPIASSILIAYGQENIDAILNSGLEGTMFYLKH